MSTVKFSNQEKLKELQSRIYLRAKISMTQQEILDLGVEILIDNLDLMIDKINQGSRIIDDDEFEKLMDIATDWGEGTEDSSEAIDEYLYGVNNDNS